MPTNCALSLSRAESRHRRHHQLEGHHANQRFWESSSKKLCLQITFEVCHSELGGQNPDELIAAFRPIRCAPDPENHPAPSGSRGQSVGTHCSAAEASKPFLRAGTMQHHRSASGSSLKVLSQHGALGRWQVSPQFLAPSESAPQHSPPDQPEPLHLHSLDLSDGALAEAAKSRTEHHRAPSVARATAAASARFRTEAQPEPQACGLSRSPPHHSSGSLQLEGVWPGLGQLGPALEGRWGATGAAWCHPG
mmetsp:Transcript_59314/g.129916  ORF Transcript_59314/g.129916 Transcript_59314/m.129916 type:complete len:250 (+) Transcript_59314:436-1185(+)